MMGVASSDCWLVRWLLGWSVGGWVAWLFAFIGPKLPKQQRNCVYTNENSKEENEKQKLKAGFPGPGGPPMPNAQALGLLQGLL